MSILTGIQYNNDRIQAHVFKSQDKSLFLSILYKTSDFFTLFVSQNLTWFGLIETKVILLIRRIVVNNIHMYDDEEVESLRLI